MFQALRAVVYLDMEVPDTDPAQFARNAAGRLGKIGVCCSSSMLFMLQYTWYMSQ